MARYGPEHKEETRRRLVESAVSTIRQRGVDSAGIKEIMNELGLTVGGFYRHFESKSELIQAAVDLGLKQSLERMRSLPDEDGHAWIEHFAAMYLSKTHRDMLAHGCVLAAIGSDIARGDEEAKEACEEGLREVHDEIERRLPDSEEDLKAQIWGLIALEVGGLLLSRMVASEKTSAEILKSCRTSVKALTHRVPDKSRPK